MTCILPSYTCGSCSRTPFSCDWGYNGLICYACCNAVSIYQPEGFASTDTCGSVLALLHGHSGRVNTVCWIKNCGKDETELISGSVDGSVVVWQGCNKGTYKSMCVLKGHEGSVTCVSAVYLSDLQDEDRETLILTASIDSTVRIWNRKGAEAIQTQLIDYKSGFALNITVCIIPTLNVPLIACGCDDQKIHLYAQGSEDKFTEVIALQGHEDWIRDAQFAIDENNDILLASCAQDNMIRMWRLSGRAQSHDGQMAVRSIADMPLEQDISVKETLFSVVKSGKDMKFAVILESVLCGHENWVYSVKWQPRKYAGNGQETQEMKLLSASMDKTMILWKPDKETGVWLEEIRVGDVGGNTLGLFGGIFSPCGQSILAHGYQGAFNQWVLNKETDRWEPQVTGGGHFGPVQDLTWSGGGGDFLVTVSTDMTSRLHAPWVRKDKKPTWFEVARPQIHGYELQCVAMLDRYSFASGADEKLVRVFTAPKNFISNFCEVCGHSAEKELAAEECQALPEGANVPALGLSNKAVFTDTGEKPPEEESKPGLYPENYFTSVSLCAPPSEPQLLQNTLWPEVAKLYGHGFEIYALAAHPNGKILASACKAAKADDAKILLWDIETKRQVATLAGPSLTITQMTFSHSGDFLLAVSRDRTWALFHKTESGDYVLKSSVDKKTSAHSRIIWSCAWSHDDQYFFTASRDKKIMVWSVAAVSSDTRSGPPSPVMAQSLPESVTAVAIAPLPVAGNKYMVATGLESGHISLHLWSPPESQGQSSGVWCTVKIMSQGEAHHLTVNRLAFRPRVGRAGYHEDGQDSKWLQLASCGADHIVRVYDIDCSTLPTS